MARTACVLLAAVFALVVGPSAAMAQPKSPEIAFDAGKVPRPDPARGAPVARVLYEYIYADQVGGAAPSADALGERLAAPLKRQLLRANRITITVDTPEVKAFLERILPDLKVAGQQPSPQERAELERMAIMYTENWRIDQILYTRYDGAVMFQQANPFEPVGAY